MPFNTGPFNTTELGSPQVAATIPMPGPVDFLSALIGFMGSDVTLIAAGLTPHFGVAPTNTPYPFLIVTEISSKIGGRTFARSYWEDTYLQFAVYATTLDQAESLSATLTTVLDAIQDNPLDFSSGTQIHFLRASSRAMKLRREGQAGNPFIWHVSSIYHARIGRTR